MNIISKIDHRPSLSTGLCALIAHPAEHSLSPIMHNAAYKKLGLDYRFYALDVLDPAKAIRAMRFLGIKGYSVSLPHKCTVMPYLDDIDNAARAIGAVNTIVNHNGRLIGYNTDWTGFSSALRSEDVAIQGKHVIVLGAGGASRAIVYALQTDQAASITMINRTYEKARALAADFDIKAAEMHTLADQLAGADILVNCTSIGMNSSSSLVPAEHLRPGLIVNDIVYTPFYTRLLQDADNQGCKVVPGYKMLLYQAIEQFQLFTDQQAPVDIMQSTLIQYLDQSSKGSI